MMKLTINGPAAAGKGTIARNFAVEANLQYVDLGLIFRFGAYAIMSNMATSLIEVLQLCYNQQVMYRWEQGKASIICKNVDVTSKLLTANTAQFTSKIAANANDQEILTALANYFLLTLEDVICDGRNAGTTILPSADYKFYATAAVHVRAQRRLLDIQALGGSATFETVLADIIERDKRDAERLTNPLIVPEGAVILRTDIMSIEESMRLIWNTISN